MDDPPSFLSEPPVLDAGVSPLPKRGRFLSFGSKAEKHTRPKADQFEANGGRKPYGEPFDEWALPTPEQLQMASAMLLLSESGVRVRFGDLFRDGKTVVIFVRHFRFTPCQDYIRSIDEELDVEAMQRAGLRFVIVGIGSHHMITPYRRALSVPWPLSHFINVARIYRFDRNEIADLYGPFTRSPSRSGNEPKDDRRWARI